jgi:hypothetical protein
MMRSTLAAVVGALFGVAATAAACGASSSGAKNAADAGAATDATAAGPDAGNADSAALDAAAESDATCPALPSVTLVPSSTSPLVVQGDPGSELGIYDPSLVYPKGAGGGIMSYSTVAPNSVHTRIATSTDLGATFQYAAEPNEVTAVTVTTSDPAFCDGGSCSVDGVLWHEVPSIVADPADTAAPYKLFVHSYVSAQGGATLRRDWGYIGMQTATSPTSWGTEQKLLGWSSDATLSTSGVTQVLTDIAELHDCVAFTEPGAIVTALGLDLALSCASSPAPGVVEIRVVLLRSTDHAQTFSFVSTLVSADDFACLDGAQPQILGPDLFTVGGTEYVVVSPVGPVSNTDAGGYRGCLTIPIADAGAGTIARAPGGTPSVVSWVESSDGRFAGPCTFAEGATAIGEIVPMQFSDQAQPWFRILPTTLPEP